MTAKRRKELLGKAGIYVSLSAITLLLIFPFVWMISTSLKDKNEMFSATPTLFPKQITLENYRSMWFDYGFGTYLRNSLTVAVSTTLILSPRFWHTGSPVSVSAAKRSFSIF